MQWFEGKPLGVELPPVVELEVVETAPGIKDATASAQRKPATLETGLVVQVPSFIESGRVDPRQHPRRELLRTGQIAAGCSGEVRRTS